MKDDWALRLKTFGLQIINELISVCDPSELIRYPNAKSLVERTLSIPFHVGLTDDEISLICKALGAL